MMSDLGFGVGVLLAILGPVLLLPAVWVCYRFVVLPLLRTRLRGWPLRVGLRPTAAAASTLLVVGALAASYVPGRIEFERLCAAHAVPDVRDRVRVDGFFRTQLYPYQARQYLEDRTFVFVEAPHPHREGIFVRYTMSPAGDLVEDEIPAVGSRFGVRQDLVSHALGTVGTEKTVYERANNRVLGRAASLVYEGGPLSIFFGVYAMRHCPDIRSPEGSRHFRTFYDLERVVLGTAP